MLWTLRMPASLRVRYSSGSPSELGGGHILIGPFPIRDIGSIDTEPIGVLFTRDALVNQLFPHAGTSDAEAWHPVDGVYRNAEAIGLITDGEFQRRVDIALFLISTDVDVVLAGSAVGQPMNQPRVSMEVENHGLIWREDCLEF